SLEYLAWLAHSQGASERAARLYGGAEALRTTFGYHLSPSDQNKHVARTAAVRAALADDALFDAAWQEGRVLSLEQVIEYALEPQTQQPAQHKDTMLPEAHSSRTSSAVSPLLPVSLPHALTALIGREQETNEIAQALCRSRLVTLVGAGGVGKTRLV